MSGSVFHSLACYGESEQSNDFERFGGGIHYPHRMTVYQAAPRGPENEAQRRFGRQGEVEDRIVHQIMFLEWECKDTFRILAGQTNVKKQTGLTVLIKVEWRSPLIQRTERRHATTKFVRWTNFFACQRPGAHEPVHWWDAEHQANQVH